MLRTNGKGAQMNDESSSCPRLLVVDDDSELRTILHDLFVDEGYQIDLAASLDEALMLISTHAYHLVLTDLLAHSTVDPLRSALLILREAHPTPVLAVTGWNTTSAEVRRAGLAYLVPKPFDVAELVEIVAAHLPTLTAEQQRQAEAARQFCAAFNAHDADGCMSLFADDVRIEPPDEPLWRASGPILGRDACRAHLEHGWSVTPDLRIESYVIFPQPHGLALRCVKSLPNDSAPGERTVICDTMTLRFTDERISGISIQWGGLPWQSSLTEAATYQPGAQDCQA